MFKKLILLSLLLLVVCIPSRSYAMPVIGDVKGIDCGYAGGPKGMDKCCAINSKSLTIVQAVRSSLSLFSSVPVLKEINEMLDEINNTQMQYGKSTRCVIGVEIQSASGCICGYSITSKSPKKIETLCRQYIKGTTPRDVNALNSCLQCTQKGNGNEYFWSALGCMPLNMQSFINNYIYVYGIGLAGIIVFLCILFNAYRIQFSQGNQEALKAAKDNLKSCLFGLILIIFAVLIVRIIGADILRIPGLK